MAGSSERSINEERQRLNREIVQLRQQAQASARQYQQQLQQLRQEMNANMRQANAELVRQHQQQLDSIAAGYNAQREALSRAIVRQKELLTQMMAEQDRQINNRIHAMERRMEAQLENERAVADSYCARMRDEWSALRSREELLPFTEPYVNIIEKAESDARIAYENRQYQAVTAIMVNSSAMISCWENEALSMHEEWLAMLGLCQDMLNCMQATLDSIRQPIECDGVSRTADLERYDPDAYARASSCCHSHAVRLNDARGMTVEELRTLLHTMESDQHVVRDATARLIFLHKAHVRRLNCHAILKKGLMKHCYAEQQVAFLERDLRNGLLVRYQHRYHRDSLLIRITTPDPETGHAEVSVMLLPDAAMDAAAQSALCSQITAYVASCLRQQPRSPLSTQAAPAYVDSSGLFRSNVTMQYQV